MISPELVAAERELFVEERSRERNPESEIKRGGGGERVKEREREKTEVGEERREMNRDMLLLKRERGRSTKHPSSLELRRGGEARGERKEVFADKRNARRRSVNRLR